MVGSCDVTGVQTCALPICVASVSKADTAVVSKFNDDDISVIDKPVTEDEDLDYFKSLAQ
jgi:hypothetical protein